MIDNLRAVEGTAVAALVRARIGDADGANKVSLRASDEILPGARTTIVTATAAITRSTLIPAILWSSGT